MFPRVGTAIILTLVSLHHVATSVQQNCVAVGNFQKDSGYSSEHLAMFEGWFGKKTSAYCSQQFPEVRPDRKYDVLLI